MNNEARDIDPEGTEAVYSLLERMRDAWSRGDAVAYAGCFTPDSYYVTYNGICLRGRTENEELHAPLFRGVLRGTRLSFTVESLTFLSEGVALVHTVGAGAKPRNRRSARRTSIQTLVIVKRNGQWQIAAFQNTRIRPVSAWLTRRMATRGRDEVAQRSSTSNSK